MTLAIDIMGLGPAVLPPPTLCAIHLEHPLFLLRPLIHREQPDRRSCLDCERGTTRKAVSPTPF